MSTTPSIDISRISSAATLKAHVAQALRAAGQHERAQQWQVETLGNEHFNGLVVKARSFVTVASSLPASQPRA